ncbi:MAG: lipid-binding SYLF domain-containing protein [Rhodospirillaceae bacterium]
MKKRYSFPGLVLVLAVLAGCVSAPKAPTSQQLVMDSLKTLEILKKRRDFPKFEEMLKDSAGVAIFPAVYKAGFFVGAEGGNGVLISRDTKGTWGYPAFYTMGAGSWGLQFGGQRASVVLILRHRGAVEAILKHQGKVGADVEFAVGPKGSGVGGGITTNLAADIVAYSDAKGLFGGMSVEGAAIVRRNDLNKEYYGQEISPSAIIVDHAMRNPQADDLRRWLTYL